MRIKSKHFYLFILVVSFVIGTTLVVMLKINGDFSWYGWVLLQCSSIAYIWAMLKYAAQVSMNCYQSEDEIDYIKLWK